MSDLSVDMLHPRSYEYEGLQIRKDDRSTVAPTEVHSVFTGKGLFKHGLSTGDRARIDSFQAERLRRQSEPPTKTTYTVDIQSRAFHTLVGGAIVVSVFLCWLEIDYQEHALVWSIAEMILAVFFLAEAYLRMRQMGICEYFKDKSCCFDFFLVICGGLSFCSSFSSDPSQHNLLVTAGILRLLRFLRIIRLFTMFRTLMVLAAGFARASQAVIWVGLLVVIINYSGALVVTQLVGRNAEWWEDTPIEVACFTGICPMDEAREQVDAWFGTVPRSMFTLFMVTTLANWPLVVDVVSVHFPPIGIILVIYIGLTTYTVLSLVTAVMSENIISAVHDDELLKLQVIEEDREQFLCCAQEAFASIDAEGAGKISTEEFSRAMRDPSTKVLEMCVKLGVVASEGHLNVSEEELLELFDAAQVHQQQGWVTLEDFVAGFSRLRGAAGAKHVLQLQFELRRLDKSHEDMAAQMVEVMEVQHKILEKLSAPPPSQ